MEDNNLFIGVFIGFAIGVGGALVVAGVLSGFWWTLAGLFPGIFMGILLIGGLAGGKNEEMWLAIDRAAQGDISLCRSLCEYPDEDDGTSIFEEFPGEQITVPHHGAQA